MEKLNSPITIITGIGNVTRAAIISEIGDISKFDSPRKWKENITQFVWVPLPEKCATLFMLF